MYSKVLIAFSSLIGVFGTVYAVLSILRITMRDLFHVVTLGGLDQRDKELFVQKEQAITGIPLVVIGWTGQTIFSFLEIETRCHFMVSLLALLLVICMEIIVTMQINRHFQRKYMEYRKKQTEETHEGSHKWGEF